MKKPICKDNRGLTLVELLVGITILAIITVPLLKIFVTSASTEVISRKYGDATDAAQNLVEQVQAADADLVLSNSVAVDTSALFYTSAHLSDGLNGTTAAPAADSNGNYYIGLKNYSYGGSSFNALVTLCASSSDEANTNPVVVGNKMDALLNMSGADDLAVVALKAECGDLVDSVDSLTITNLTRSITLNVNKTDTTTYKIDAVFTYTATIPYVVKTKTSYYYFSYSEQTSQSVGNIASSTDNDPILSVFLFFNAYYKDSLGQETIHINNQTTNLARSDVNVFLVNTGTANLTQTNYHANVWYKYQKFDSSNKPVNNLVFTNLNKDVVNKDLVTYYAFTNDLLRKTLTVSGYLVETKQINRKFSVNVKLFEPASNFSGTPIVSIDSIKLNY